MRKIIRSLGSLFALLFVPAILLFFFGFFARTTDEYACALQVASQDSRVIAVTGEPVEAGTFAWTSYFESGGSLSQGAFNTAITGPEGRGNLHVEFYRSPVGSSLYLEFKSGREKVVVYDGAYPCR